MITTTEVWIVGFLLFTEDSLFSESLLFSHLTETLTTLTERVKDTISTKHKQIKVKKRNGSKAIHIAN